MKHRSYILLFAKKLVFQKETYRTRSTKKKTIELTRHSKKKKKIETITTVINQILIEFNTVYNWFIYNRPTKNFQINQII